MLSRVNNVVSQNPMHKRTSKNSQANVNHSKIVLKIKTHSIKEKKSFRIYQQTIRFQHANKDDVLTPGFQTNDPPWISLISSMGPKSSSESK